MYNGAMPLLEDGLRYLALDVGEKTIGLAVCDTTGQVARPVGTIRRTDAAADFSAIGRAADELEADALVIGYPVRLDGTPGDASRKMDRFARRLRGRLGRSVVGVDERFTSLEAAELLAAPKSRKRRFDDHALAAALILRRLLEEGDAVVLARW
jgi:putative Holliday junction resolvase